MISMLWMRYQQLSLACSFATFLILMNFHQLTHLLVRFRLFFSSSALSRKLLSPGMKPWCIWYTYITLRTFLTQPSHNFLWIWDWRHWSFDGARYDMRRWSWTSKIWHTFCSATWSKWATLKSTEPAMNMMRPQMIRDFEVISRRFNKSDRSWDKPKFLGSKLTSRQCRPKYYALHTKLGVIRFHQMLWCHHRNGNLGNSLCWQISIQAVGIPVQHIFYEDLAGNSANLEARISQISTEFHFRPLRSCSAKAVRRFLRQNTSCPPVQLSKAADTQLGLPKFREVFPVLGRSWRLPSLARKEELWI